MKKRKVLRVHAVLGLLFLNICIFSCVTTQPQISQSGIFHPGHGFSVQFPQGKTWDIKKMDNAIIAFKRPQVGYRSFFLGAEEFTPDQGFRSPEEFLMSFKKSIGAGSFSNRHEMIHADYSLRPDIAPFCVYYSLKYKDYNAKNIGDNSFLIIETTGYSVLHPDSSKSGFNVYYSERYLDNHDPDLQREGDEFIKTLKVLPIK